MSTEWYRMNILEKKKVCLIFLLLIVGNGIKLLDQVMPCKPNNMVLKQNKSVLSNVGTWIITISSLFIAKKFQVILHSFCPERK